MPDSRQAMADLLSSLRRYFPADLLDVFDARAATADRQRYARAAKLFTPSPADAATLLCYPGETYAMTLGPRTLEIKARTDFGRWCLELPASWDIPPRQHVRARLAARL
jgi:hypothetical protein